MSKSYINISFEGVATVVVVCFFILLLVSSQGFKYFKCKNYGDLTERDIKYSIINGCFVKTPSGLIPQEEMSKRAYGNSITEGSN